VLCLDTKSSDFFSKTANNPALFSHCRTLWREQLSEGSMTSLAKHRLAPLAVKGTEALLVRLHQLARTRPNPQFFWNMLHNYTAIFQNIRGGKDAQAIRLKAGLAKLEDANQVVHTLSSQAKIEEGKLTAKQKEADKALVSITAAMKEAAEQKAETEKI
jgi:hypothetical protein